MPKLAIYVPKQEMKKIDRWRKKINFSRVFMQALAREIKRQSQPAAGNDKLAAAAVHYGQQLSDDLSPVRELGLQLGTADVMDCRLTMPEIQASLRLIESSGGEKGDLEEAGKRALKHHRKKIMAFAEKQRMDDVKHPGWRRNLLDGYVEGVQTAWDEVCRVMNESTTSNRKKK